MILGATTGRKKPKVDLRALELAIVIRADTGRHDSDTPYAYPHNAISLDKKPTTVYDVRTLYCEFTWCERMLVHLNRLSKIRGSVMPVDL